MKWCAFSCVLVLVQSSDQIMWGGGVGQQNGRLVAQCLCDESASASVLIVGPLQEKFSPCILGESCVSLESYIQAN